MAAHSIQSTAHEQSRDRLLGSPAVDHALGALALAAGYYATAQLGESLAFPDAPVSALWLPNALVMGGLLLAPKLVRGPVLSAPSTRKPLAAGRFSPCAGG